MIRVCFFITSIPKQSLPPTTSRKDDKEEEQRKHGNMPSVLILYPGFIQSFRSRLGGLRAAQTFTADAAAVPWCGSCCCSGSITNERTAATRSMLSIFHLPSNTPTHTLVMKVQDELTEWVHNEGWQGGGWTRRVRDWGVHWGIARKVENTESFVGNLQSVVFLVTLIGELDYGWVEWIVGGSILSYGYWVLVISFKRIIG